MNLKFFSITKLHTPHGKGCQIIRPLVNGCWLLVTGHWLLASSQKREASGQNADTRNLKP